MSHVLRDAGGTVTVTSAALAQLVVHAADGVEGARVRRGRRRHLDVAIENGKARVEVELTARHGVVLPEVSREVQARIADALVAMCEVDAVVVDVSVEDVE